MGPLYARFGYLLGANHDARASVTQADGEI